MPWQGARAAGDGRGDPALATDARKDACGDGNSKGGPMLAMDTHRNDIGNGNFWQPPALGKVTLHGTDTLA